MFAQSLYNEHLAQPYTHQIDTETVSVDRVVPYGGLVSPYATFAVLFNQVRPPSSALPSFVDILFDSMLILLRW